jgi:uncharacterized phage protein (TIGR02220 family)
MTPTYRIANWAALYENNRTRELKSLTWVPFPNSHDGDGYTALMSQKNAEQLLGAFVVIVQVASKCDPRGTLLRGPAMPHTAASIARITRFSERTIQRCLDVCCDPEIGWILRENANENGENATIPQDAATSCDRAAPSCLEGKGMEGKEQKGNEPAVMLLSFLNESAGRDFREVAANLDPIRARLEEVKGDIDGVKAMISRQVALWKGDPVMDEYLRPETLFRKAKFAGYYDNRFLPVAVLKKVESRPPTITEMKTQRDMVETQLNVLRNQHGSGPLAKPWSEDDKVKREELKKRIAELNDRIAKGGQ